MSLQDKTLCAMAERARWYADIDPEVEREWARFVLRGKEGDKRQVIQWAIWHWMQLPSAERESVRNAFAEWIESGSPPLTFAKTPAGESGDGANGATGKVEPARKPTRRKAHG